MARDTLTGSRIRERRIMGGLKQADLARRAGISASYLNLIEHNRRRIGGKLLLDIAEALDVEPAMLAEGAEATLIAGLREAASDLP
ncbi:MAG: helix-turn-helix transcriptional regulator, partial [Rhodobacteraceae bacterium]|nr:helix-turn-helix transcriptional regulator [Paracoccaceae bacterium]